MASVADNAAVLAEIMKGMFVRLPMCVYRCGRLSAGAKLLYAVILHLAWRREPYPGHRDIAEAYGFSERSCKNYVRELARLRLVKIGPRLWGQPLEIELLSLDTNSLFSGANSAPNGAKTALSSGKNCTCINDVDSVKTQRRNTRTNPVEKIIAEFGTGQRRVSMRKFLQQFSETDLAYAANVVRSRQNVKNATAYLYGILQRIGKRPTAHRPKRPMQPDEKPLTAAQLAIGQATLEEFRRKARARKSKLEEGTRKKIP